MIERDAQQREKGRRAPPRTDGAPTPEDQPTADVSVGPPSPAPPRTEINPGQFLAERYHITRFIARGGMGEVYEAEDLELGEMVALKTIRPDIAQHAPAIERFKREIQLARKIAHPSISRVFDLGLHRPPGDAAPVAFYTMELLSGETLAQRLRDSGRMSVEQALPIVEQIAEGLAAAHRHGIVHRDLKTANVMLMPTAEGTRVVVTDFGLARVADGQKLERSTPALVGTADYMAPEQVTGDEVAPAADIYALGIVLYEMVTGSLPFGGDTPLSTAAKRLVEPPPSPRTRVPDLPAHWEAAILRCLERQPRRRFATATDLVDALRGPKARGRAWLAAAAGALLLALAAGFVTSRMRDATAINPIAAPARRSVAVVGLKNLAGRPDAAWLSTAFAEMLTTELAAGGRLRAIPGENVARMRIELALPESESLAPNDLTKVGNHLNADLLLTGSQMLLPSGQIRLDLRLQQVATGETLVAIAESGTTATLFDIVARAGRRVRQAIQVDEPQMAEAAAAKAGLPADLEAQRHFAEGVAKLHLLDALGARDLLVKAAALEPRSPAVHSALADAWSKLGYGPKAAEEAKRAFELSAGLAREERLWIEALYRETAGEWEPAVEIYRALFAFYPDNLEYGLRLAAAQAWAGKGSDALACLDKLRRLPTPVSQDPRIDLAEAQIAQTLGDAKTQEVAAERAAAKGGAQGSRLLVAQARLLDAFALGRLGEPQQAAEAADTARKIYEEAGDKGGMAWALHRKGSVLFLRGGFDEARVAFERALEIFEQIGHRGGACAALNNLGQVSWQAGELERASELYQRAESVAREVGDQRALVHAMTNRAQVAYEQARLDDARARYERSMEACRALGDKTLEAIIVAQTADVMVAQGDLAGAETQYRRALGVLRQRGNRRYQAFAAYGLAEALSAMDQLAAARALHEEALAIREETRDEFTVAESRLALARLALAQGRLDDAQTLAHSAASVFHERGGRGREGTAYAVLALAQLATAQPVVARQSMQRATELARRSQRPAGRLAVEMMGARVEAATGAPAAALQTLEACRAEALRLGLVGVRLETELARAEIDSDAVPPAVVRARASEIADQAHRHGFDSIAHRAQRLFTQGPLRAGFGLTSPPPRP